MTTPGIQITFDKASGQYTAHQEIPGGMCGGFGSTPEEAVARLELAKSRWRSCELCREARRECRHTEAPDSADPPDSGSAAG